jgi:hypothetical protein
MDSAQKFGKFSNYFENFISITIAISCVHKICTKLLSGWPAMQGRGEEENANPTKFAFAIFFFVNFKSDQIEYKWQP